MPEKQHHARFKLSRSHLTLLPGTLGCTMLKEQRTFANNWWEGSQFQSSSESEAITEAFVLFTPPNFRELPFTQVLKLGG